jgi:tetratricopeptide (TPR) repeat protein
MPATAAATAKGEGGDALAFVFAGLMAAIVLLPAGALLDLKPAAALLAAAVLGLGWARRRPLQGWEPQALQAWRWALLALCATALALQGGQRVSGSFGNAAYLAGFLVLSWPLLLGRPWALGLALLTLVATGTRAAWLALAVQGAWLAWREARWRRGIALVGALLAGAAALRWGLQDFLRPTARLQVWQRTLAAAWERPWLGHGFEAFALQMDGRWGAALTQQLAETAQYVEHPHQVLLSVFFHTGLVGLLGFGLALGLLWRARLDPALRLGLLGLLAQAQFDRYFFHAGLLGPPALLLALRLPRPARGLSIALALGLSALAMVPLWQWRQAVGPAGQLGPAPVTAPKLDAGSTDPAHWDRQGTALASQGAFHEAAGAFRQALRLQPTSGRAQNLGNSLFAQGLFKEAEAAYREAVRLDPGSADAHFSLGYALYRLNRIRDAMASLDAALKLQPGHAEAATLKRQILR